MAKLATQFLENTTPEPTGGVLLFDPVTGLRERLTIAQFFARFGITVDVDSVTIPQLDGDLLVVGNLRASLGVTADDSVTIEGTTPRLYMTPASGGFTEIRLGDATDSDRAEIVSNLADDSMRFRVATTDVFKIFPTVMEVYKNLKLTNLPTTNPGGTGLVWNDGGTLKIT